MKSIAPAFVLLSLFVFFCSGNFSHADEVMQQTSASNQKPEVTTPVYRTQNGSIGMHAFSKDLLQLNSSWNKEERDKANAESGEEPEYAGHTKIPYSWGVGMPPAASDGPINNAGPVGAKK